MTHTAALVLDNPTFNKRTVFTHEEREAYGLQGLLSSIYCAGY